ncbi:hypothetical protein BO71DRAFT_442188 [Aspergillus ellipticus CBS 707.79]|uniref:Uncharacterized protein n=1 Tax=Aspergillus ellipticus CBS 707.79 TaxID=1448320 RepID=A0A319D677_9EURO|nr:hypothetical protein BO71DRAFT_442188 [Aspergillus ellipticus CBS 707.79]
MRFLSTSLVATALTLVPVTVAQYYAFGGSGAMQVYDADGTDILGCLTADAYSIFGSPSNIVANFGDEGNGWVGPFWYAEAASEGAGAVELSAVASDGTQNATLVGYRLL